MTATSSSRAALAFDLDGTIVDGERRDYQVYVDTLEELGQEHLPRRAYWDLRRDSTPVIDILAASGAGHVVAEFLVDRQRRIELLHYLALDTLIPGAKDVLRAVSAHYDPVLVTARFDAAAVKWQLDLLGIATMFSRVIVTSGDKTEAFRSIGGLCLVVGDTEKDVLPAKLLGIKVAAVASGIRSAQRLADMEPDHLLDNIQGVLGLLSLP